jgi:diguanylate cyclase (GGDEF)-like protein/PAS domain S-box-containing protein
MAANIKMRRLFEIHKEFWTFKADRDPATRELIARQQLKLMSDVSRIVTIAMIPVAIYLIVHLVMHANRPFIASGLFGLAVVISLSIRNFRRQGRRDGFDMEAFRSTRRMLCRESIIVALALSLGIAFPLAFGQIPFDENSVILALGCIVVGGFTYGSIPRAQTLFIVTTSLLLATSFLFVRGVAGLQSIGLLLFFAASVDSIYRLFFFNFAKRHTYAAKQKDAVETVKLLLNDYAEQSSDWLWETDENRRIVLASDRFAKAAGRTAGSLNGTCIADLFVEGDERRALLQLIAQGKPIRKLDLPIYVNGEKRWWRISCRFLNPSAGSSRALRGVATDITFEKEAKDQIAHLAHFDSLTKLPNRASFNESLKRSLSRLHSPQSLAVLYLDVDRFKAINDSMGHSVGDRVLQEVARRLTAAAGPADIVARLSGDEFAICLNQNTGSDDALRIASGIVDDLSEPLMIDGQLVNAGVSAGVAVSTGDSGSAERLLQHADIALYKSKHSGRGRTTLFETYMLDAIQDRQSIEMDMRIALQRNEFELHYQPLFDIGTKQPIGYEALIRWGHPTKGMIMPNDFIPVAEATGLIIQLGEWVLRTALQELRNWPDHLSVSVNLSPAQMHSPNLLPTIIHGLAAAGVESHRLELEITETVIMNHNQANLDLLNKIHSLGVQIALDDFGTGYSSLNYLRSFPFNKIKIDRCFVEEVDSRADCRAIIRAITGLASSLGMVTTAEGIERVDQLDMLRRAGCTQAQGYLFSKAVPAHEIEGRLMAGRPQIAALTQIGESRSIMKVEEAKRKTG